MILKFWRLIHIYGLPCLHGHLESDARSRTYIEAALGQELILTTKTNAATVLKDDVIVGHVPYDLAPRLSQCLRREVNNAFAEVMGEKVNRGAGYTLEIPCVYPL